MTLGIIDVGTNSIHLVVGRLHRSGRFRVIVHYQDLTRLGEGSLSRGRLTKAAMRRAFAVLELYKDFLRRYQVDRVEAVATSAVREAANGRAFVRRVRTALGLPLRAISGRQEARLIYRGVVATHRLKGTILLVSLGGGSAQVMVGHGEQLRYVTSVLLGGARLAERFIRHDPATLRELEALDRHVWATWAPVIRAIRRERWDHAIASSAAVDLLVHVWNRLFGPQPSGRGSGPMITQQALQDLVGWLSTSTVAERVAQAGLDPKRQDLALATAVTLLQWMEGCKVLAVRVVPGSLREGLVRELFDELSTAA